MYAKSHNPQNEDFYAYDPYERPHPFLEVLCSCCLPESRSKPSYEAERVHFWSNYLEFLNEADIGLDGES